MTTENIKRVRVIENLYSVVAGNMPNQPSSSSSPAADNVASIDDLLTEILIRLPARSLLRCKSVSRHWYYLISSPSFYLLRNPKTDPPSGLFVRVLTYTTHMEFDFVPFDIGNTVKPPFRTLNFDPEVNRIYLEDSSNGLILCSSLAKDNNYRYINKHYVYNPTMDQFTTLPRLGTYDFLQQLGMTIVFDPSKSPHYRIVYMCGLGMFNPCRARYKIEIYSSETNTCKVSCCFSLDDDYDADLYFGAGIYWNNAVHWLLHDKGFLLYYNLDREVVNRVPTPFHLLGAYHKTYMYESRDHLLLVDIPYLNSKLEIYEMGRDYAGWILKYKVDLEVVGRSFPESLIPHRQGQLHYTLLSVVLGEKEDDSFLVLLRYKIALRFNLVSRTCHKLHDFTACPDPIRCIDFGGVYIEGRNTFEFTESLYSV